MLDEHDERRFTGFDRTAFDFWLRRDDVEVCDDEHCCSGGVAFGSAMVSPQPHTIIANETSSTRASKCHKKKG